ncbi:carbohydrate binding domain-containing protein [Paenibacillus sp. FSL R5-0519]|uniref:carbohydrate binding domain-containing protein n=1 Tax=Paenibacillus sp. FSL R5-0519 TaxID=2921648 RepID=UPI0030D78AEF
MPNERSYHGPMLSMKDLLERNQEYEITAYVRLTQEPTTDHTLQLTTCKKTTAESWNPIGSVKIAKTEWNSWHKITGKFQYSDDPTELNLFIETPYLSEDSVDTLSFYVDDVSFTLAEQHEIEEGIPSLEDLYQDDFPIGAAVYRWQLDGAYGQLLTKHFNSLTETYEMKPKYMFKNIQSLIGPFSELYSSWEHWFHRELHWCSKCMEGDHSWLHQFKLLDECAFHDLKLNNTFPNCRSTIPFLLSNRQLEHAFQCKCGYAFATFYMSSWNEWRAPDQMNPAVLRWVQANKANMKISNMHSKWIIHAQHFPKKDLLQVTSYAVQQVVLFQSILKSHQHCITQLMELRKSNETIEFPEICPYAYAFVFWRKSLLKEEHFYGFIPLRTRSISDSAPLLIRELLEYFSDQIVKYQMKIRGSFDMGGLSWILENWSYSFVRISSVFGWRPQ